MRVNEQGYVERKSMGSGKPSGGNSRAVWRNWWLVKYHGTCKEERGQIGKLQLPKEYIGKRVRFKIEVMED